MAKMQRMFNRSSTSLQAGRVLLCLRQGTDTVSNYAIEFQMLVTDSGWEGRALVDTFPARASGVREGRVSEARSPGGPGSHCRHGDPCRRSLGGPETSGSSMVSSSAMPGPTTQAVTAAPDSEERGPLLFTIPPPKEESEAMMVDRSRVSRQEWDRRQRARACFGCGEVGHLKDHAH